MAKLAIASIVAVSVAFSLNENGVTRQHKFQLICDRKDADTLAATMEDKDLTVKAFLDEVVTGWKDQKLVLNEDDTPAAFSRENFDLLTSIPGMVSVIYGAYLKEVGAKAKN